jgi:hypothetical protein
MGYKALLALLTCIVSTGCQQEAEISVAQQGERISFTVQRSDEDACVREIGVYASAEAIDPIWSLGRAGDAPCRSTFSYGEAVPGYETSGVAPRLQPGREYWVSVSGGGMIGGTKFTKAP